MIQTYLLYHECNELIIKHQFLKIKMVSILKNKNGINFS